MSKGQFGARDLQKHLRKLPVPEFDPALKLHADIAKAGARAAAAAGKKLEELREQWADRLTVTIVRREMRNWLHASTEGKAVETFVGRLLASG